jgi:hypothetical protein
VSTEKRSRFGRAEKSSLETQSRRCSYASSSAPRWNNQKNKLVYHVDGGGGNGYADLLSSLRDGNFRSHLVRLDILAGQRGHNSSAIPRIRRGRPAKPMQEREAGERRERKSAM